MPGLFLEDPAPRGPRWKGPRQLSAQRGGVLGARCWSTPGEVHKVPRVAIGHASFAWGLARSERLGPVMARAMGDAAALVLGTEKSLHESSQWAPPPARAGGAALPQPPASAAAAARGGGAGRTSSLRDAAGDRSNGTQPAAAVHPLVSLEPPGAAAAAAPRRRRGSIFHSVYWDASRHKWLARIRASAKNV